MHGYCNCKRCNEEWAARNSYHPEDDLPAPHKKAGKKASVKKHPGCPGNEGKAHIYVWVKSLTQRYHYWHDADGWHSKPMKGEYLTSHRHVCLGCGKLNPKRRWSARPPAEQIYDTQYHIW